MLDLFVIGIANFALIGLKAAQQLNVVHDKYLWIPLMSIGLAVTEVIVIVKIVETGFIAVVPMIIGGVLGCWIAMYVHKRCR